METIKDIVATVWTDCKNRHRLYPENNHTFSDYWGTAGRYFEKFTLLESTPIIATDNTLPPSSPSTAEEDFFKSIKWRIGKVITSKFLESNEGKFHTALEFNPAIHAAAEFCEHEKQEARRQAIDEIQTMIMQGNRAMTVVDFYDELEKLKK